MRRLTLAWIRFIAWVWLAMTIFGVVDSARVRFRCPGTSTSWAFVLLMPATAAVPFLYLRWVRRWYERHPPVAWFSTAWWRRAAGWGLVISLIFLIPLGGWEIISHRIGGSLAEGLAEKFVHSDYTVQKRFAEKQFRQGGGGFTYTAGAWHAYYKFRVTGTQPEDLIIVHLDRTDSRWNVSGWELDSHYHASFFRVVDDKTVPAILASPKSDSEAKQPNSALKESQQQGCR